MLNGALERAWKLDRRSDDFRWLVAERLELHVGDRLVLENHGPAGLTRVQEVRLEIGDLSQEVTVKSQAPLIDGATTSVGHVMRAEMRPRSE